VQIPTLAKLKKEDYNLFLEHVNDDSDPPLQVVMPAIDDPNSDRYISPQKLLNAYRPQKANEASFFSKFKTEHDSRVGRGLTGWVQLI